MAFANTKLDKCSFRIALTDPGLATGYLHLYGLALPTTINYQGFSGEFSRGAGAKVLHGYKNCTLTWVDVDAKTVYRIKKFADDALASGTGLLYLTVPYNDGSVVGRTYIDISGVPHPITTQEAGNISGLGLAYDNLQLFINNITIINNPAQF